MLTVRFANQPSDLFGPLRIRRRRDFEVEGAGFFEASDDCLLAPLPVVKDASLISLRHAIGRYNHHYGTDKDPLTMLISEDRTESFRLRDDGLPEQQLPRFPHRDPDRRRAHHR